MYGGIYYGGGYYGQAYLDGEAPDLTPPVITPTKGYASSQALAGNGSVATAGPAHGSQSEAS